MPRVSKMARLSGRNSVSESNRDIWVSFNLNYLKASFFHKLTIIETNNFSTNFFLCIVKTLAEKDSYCWMCHRTQTNKFCSSCIRTYHLKCLKGLSSTDDPWKCPECKEIEESDANAIQ